MRSTICLTIFLTIFGVVFSESQFQSDTLNSLLTSYDKTVKPKSPTGPVKIGVSLYFEYVEWSKNKVDVAVYLRQTWNDPRLDRKSDVTRFTAANVIENIWKPNTFFVNELHSKVINHGQIDINTKGDIYWSQYLFLTFPCPSNNSDATEVNCKLQVESYSLLYNDLVYKWIDKPAFSNVVQAVKLIDNAEVKNKYPSGDYAALTYNIKISVK